MSLPPSEFADAFRAHSVPKILSVIEIRGHFVGLGLYDFSDAYSDAVAYAGRLGAYLLPEEHFAILTDWIGSALADVAAEVEAQCVG